MGDAAWTVVNGQAISAGSIAVVIKLTRTVLLVFVALAVMLVKAFSASKAGAAASGGSFVKRLAKAFPVFVLGFLLLAVLNTAVDFSRLAVGPLSLGQILSKGSKYFISVALVGVGCKIKLRDLFTKGAKPVLLGGCTWVAVSLVTLAYLFLFT
jgi:uncharacterized membrane protein YadS